MSINTATISGNLGADPELYSAAPAGYNAAPADVYAEDIPF